MTSKLFKSLNILAFLFLTANVAQAKVLEKIYAVVNGDTITLTEIQDYQKKLKEGGFLDDLLFSDPKVRQKAIDDKAYLIKLLIDEKIIDFEVKQNSLQVTQERVDKEIETIAKRQQMTAGQLKRTLRDQGVNFADYRDFVKKSVERRQLVQKEITSKIKISDQDIVSHYLQKNGASKSQVYEFFLAHILLEGDQEAKAKELTSELEKGSSFESLVTEHSTDSDSKSKSGQFGRFKSGEMLGAIEDAIQPLKVGETSKVVKTPMGLHIFKILDKKLIKDPAIDRQKQAIYQGLFAKAFKEQLSFWLIQKRKDAIIQINKSS